MRYVHVEPNGYEDSGDGSTPVSPQKSVPDNSSQQDKSSPYELKIERDEQAEAEQVPGLGGVSVGVGYGSESGNLTPSVNGKVLGGSLSVYPGGVKLGYAPDVGPGGRVGIDYDLEGSQYFLISRGYLDDTGLDKFGEYYAPNAVLQDMHFETGHLDQRLGGWVSGLEMLRCKVGVHWEIPYKEVPKCDEAGQ